MEAAVPSPRARERRRGLGVLGSARGVPLPSQDEAGRGTARRDRSRRLRPNDIGALSRRVELHQSTDAQSLMRWLPIREARLVPNVVYLLHQAPTTSIPLNSLGARGWQMVSAPV